MVLEFSYIYGEDDCTVTCAAPCNRQNLTIAHRSLHSAHLNSTSSAVHYMLKPHTALTRTRCVGKGSSRVDHGLQCTHCMRISCIAIPCINYGSVTDVANAIFAYAGA